MIDSILKYPGEADWALVIRESLGRHFAPSRMNQVRNPLFLVCPGMQSRHIHGVYGLHAGFRVVDRCPLVVWLSGNDFMGDAFHRMGETGFNSIVDSIARLSYYEVACGVVAVSVSCVYHFVGVFISAFLNDAHWSLVFGGNSRLWGYRGVRPERWCDWYDYMVRAVVNHVYHRWQDLSSQLGLSPVASPMVLCMTLFCRSLFFPSRVGIHVCAYHQFWLHGGSLIACGWHGSCIFSRQRSSHVEDCIRVFLSELLSTTMVRWRRESRTLKYRGAQYVTGVLTSRCHHDSDESNLVNTVPRSRSSCTPLEGTIG